MLYPNPPHATPAGSTDFSTACSPSPASITSLSPAATPPSPPPITSSPTSSSSDPHPLAAPFAVLRLALATSSTAPELSAELLPNSQHWPPLPANSATRSPPATIPILFPQPRLAVGQTLLRRRLATACIDLSDGLSTDLAHLCTASHVAAELDLAQLPLHPPAATLDDRAQITALLHGGEDYELLFTAGSSTKIPRSIANVPITRIGRIVKPQKNQPQMSLLSDGLRFELQSHGWEHLT